MIIKYTLQGGNWNQLRGLGFSIISAVRILLLSPNQCYGLYSMEIPGKAVKSSLVICQLRTPDFDLGLGVSALIEHDNWGAVGTDVGRPWFPDGTLS